MSLRSIFRQPYLDLIVMDRVYNKGVTLLLSVLILTVTLSIALGIFYIVLIQLQLNRSTLASHLAFFNANTGIECARYYNLRQGIPFPFPGQVDFWDAAAPCTTPGSPGLPGGGSCNSSLITCAGGTVKSLVVTALGQTTSSQGLGLNPGPHFQYDVEIDEGDACVSLVIDSDYRLYDPGGGPITHKRTLISSRGKSTCSADADAVNRTIELCTAGVEEDCPL
jgi:hypothetical protein